MYLDEPNLDKISAIWQDCIEASRIFMQGAPVKTENVLLPTESDIDFSSIKSVYIIKQGVLKETYMDNMIVMYEVGDLVGTNSLLGNSKTVISTDFSVEVDEYDLDSLLEHIRSDDTRFAAWNTYLVGLMQSYKIMVCFHKSDDVQFHPEMRHYDKGDVIIQEGSHDNEVFTLMSGSAKVYVKDALVGEVRCDELFGAIAALTNTVRTATVKADSSCSVLVVPSTSFKELLSSRPDTVAKLIEDMARTIISSNKKIVSQENMK